jgi:hypothetical protein
VSEEVGLPVEERSFVLKRFPREVPHGFQFFRHLYGVSGEPEEFATLAPPRVPRRGSVPMI